MMRCLKSSEAAQMSYHDIAVQLEVDIQVGLSEYEVGQRRRNHGYNEFDITDEEPLWKKYLGQACYQCIIHISTCKVSSKVTMDLCTVVLYHSTAFKALRLRYNTFYKRSHSFTVHEPYLQQSITAHWLVLIAPTH